MAIELRDYQEECVKRVLAAYRYDPCGQELIVLPTGAGKTVIFSHVIHSLAGEYGLSALIICHRDELLNQAADKYRLIKPDAVIGKVGSGLHQYGGEVTVASVATISRPEHLKHLRALYGTGKKLLIIVDESHHAASESYQRVLQALPDAFVLMVTATPDRLDKKQIINKVPLYQATILDMIRQRYLCDVRAIAVKTETTLDNIHTVAGDYNQEELDLAVNTPERNKRIVEAYQEYTPGKRAIVFAVTVSHAEAIAYAFNDAGIPAAMVEGNTPLDERQHLYRAFRLGEIKVLTNVMVLSEGYDEPLVECIAMARPTQSRALYTQAAGRGLRPAPGKKYCTILDLTDNCLRLRLTPPQNFKTIIHKQLQPDETLLEALAREENEKTEKVAPEKRALIRKLNERRDQDLTIDLFGLPDWVEMPNGLFVIHVGLEKHRIAIAPTPGMDGLYDVWARLAPRFEAQKWLSSQPLDWAMTEAEKRARKLIAEPAQKILLDKNALWRNDPIDPAGKQVKFLKWKNIPWNENMTKGEASDLIDAYKQKKEREAAAKEQRKAERMGA